MSELRAVRLTGITSVQARAVLPEAQKASKPVRMQAA
jgi:hypothetical protein